MLDPEVTQLRTSAYYYFYSQCPDPHAPLILFLHGFPDNALVWERQWEGLKDKYNLLAPNLPGTFKGKRLPDSRYGRNAVCLDLMELVSRVDPERKKALYLVGHDMGGPHLERLCQYWPDRVKGLIFINSLGFKQFLSRMRDPDQVKKSTYMLPFQLPILPEFLMEAFHQKTLNKIYDKGLLHADDEMRRGGFPVFWGIQQYREFFKEIPKQVRKGDSSCQTPTLFICGEDDPFIKVPCLDEAEKYFVNSQVRVLQGGHWIQRDSWQRVNTLLKKAIGEWQKC